MPYALPRCDDRPFLWTPSTGGDPRMHPTLKASPFHPRMNLLRRLVFIFPALLALSASAEEQTRFAFCPIILDTLHLTPSGELRPGDPQNEPLLESVIAEELAKLPVAHADANQKHARAA